MAYCPHKKTVIALAGKGPLAGTRRKRKEARQTTNLQFFSSGLALHGAFYPRSPLYLDLYLRPGKWESKTVVS